MIKNNKIDILLDIRLSNKSQLAGFTKGTDLPYFLKELCDCKYEHCEEFAPTKDILDRYKKAVISWDEYIKEYTKLIYKRGDYKKFKNIIIAFREYYDLEEFNLKEIDQYLWQLGKEYFPNKY